MLYTSNYFLSSMTLIFSAGLAAIQRTGGALNCIVNDKTLFVLSFTAPDFGR